MNPSVATRFAAAAGFLAVALGAFGAHGLRDLLAQNGTATMLFVLAERKPFPAAAWWSFLAGIVIFSGSLYLLAVTNARWLGAITPVGGASFLVGWGVLLCCPKQKD
jgi:uncharacterized membrane protein YgdD (TMEM256/DUF423 family)